MREIGVGYDGSAESEHALGVALKLAGAHDGTKLSAFKAVSFAGHIFAGPPVPDDATIEELVDAAGACSGHRRGRPARRLLPAGRGAGALQRLA